MRTLQEVFDAVIATGVYSGDVGPVLVGHNQTYKYDFMCICLKMALRGDVITRAEYKRNMDSIEAYIIKLGGEGTGCVLYAVLRKAKLVPALSHDEAFNIMLGIYTNWAKRPQPKKVKSNGDQ
jgi:hypothetical protein